MKLDPSYLGELSRLSFHIKRKIFDKYSGDERTKNTGDGLMFKDHSQYVLGDDVRRIDWKVFARTRELYVKRYEADRNLTLHVALDASGSMDYGEDDENKFQHAAKLAVALAHVLSKHQGRVRFATFAQELHQARSVSGTASLASMLKTLELTKVGGHTQLSDALLEYKQRMLRSKSSVVVFSDFLLPIEEVHRLCTTFTKTHLMLIHVAHADEVSLPYRGDFKVRDAESAAVARVHVSPRFAQQYQQKYKEHVQHINRLAQDADIQHVHITTDKPIIENFMRIWEKM